MCRRGLWIQLSSAFSLHSSYLLLSLCELWKSVTMTDTNGTALRQKNRFCRKVRFLGQNPKIGYQQFNDLQTAKLSKKQLSDRTIWSATCHVRVTQHGIRSVKIPLDRISAV